MKKTVINIPIMFTIVSITVLRLGFGSAELLAQSLTFDKNMDLISKKWEPAGFDTAIYCNSNDSCPRIGIISTGLYPLSVARLVSVGFNNISLLSDTSGLAEFKDFDIIYLPESWAELSFHSYENIESNASDYITYVENGGNIFIEQPNPYMQPGDSIRPTIIPYPITFHNFYDYNDFPPVAIDSTHEITKNILREDLPFPGDTMTSVDDHYHTLVVGAYSQKPSLVILEFGLGRIIVCTANPSPDAIHPFGDEIYVRMIDWLVKREYTTEPITACFSYTWIDSITYTESNNTATYTYSSVNGCDSIIKLDLTIIKVDTSVYLRNDTIFSEAIDAEYQWLNCDENFEIIYGETDQSYIPNESGNYAVQVFQNNCTDTSSCINFSPNMLNNSSLNKLNIYPNPTDGQIVIDLKNLRNPSIKIFNELGIKINETTYANEKIFKYRIKGNSGLYIIEVINENESYFYKVFKK